MYTASLILEPREYVGRFDALSEAVRSHGGGILGHRSGMHARGASIGNGRALPGEPADRMPS